MNLKLHKELIEAIGIPTLKKHGLNIDEDSFRSWKRNVDVDLSVLSSK
jgi:hypothetical protein